MMYGNTDTLGSSPDSPIFSQIFFPVPQALSPSFFMFGREGLGTRLAERGLGTKATDGRTDALSIVSLSYLIRACLSLQLRIKNSADVDN